MASQGLKGGQYVPEAVLLGLAGEHNAILRGATEKVFYMRSIEYQPSACDGDVLNFFYFEERWLYAGTSP